MTGAVAKKGVDVLKRAIRAGATVVEREAPDGFEWPGAIVFLGDDCSLYRPKGSKGTAADSLNVTIFNPRNSRAFPEHDLPIADESGAQVDGAETGAARGGAKRVVGRGAGGDRIAEREL